MALFGPSAAKPPWPNAATSLAQLWLDQGNAGPASTHSWPVQKRHERNGLATSL